MSTALVIRPLDPDCRDEIELVARRMHLTIAEVLGESRARAMYSHEQLVERVLWHVVRPEGRRAEVFLAQTDEGVIAGHVIVRVEHEQDGDRDVGLFSTIYVDPAQRRSGLASELLRHGEAWMREQGQQEAVTYTDAGNAPLQQLFAAHGYALAVVDDEWVRLSRPLPRVDPC